MLFDWIEWAVNGKSNWDVETQEALRDEFSTLISDDSQKYIFDLRKFIVMTDMELQQVNHIASYLRIYPDPELIKVLNGAPYFVNLTFENAEADINRMLAIYKQKEIKLKVKEAEYVKYIESQPKEGSTMQDWYGQVSVLSKWLGFQIPVKETSVLLYTVYLNSFKKENKANV